MRVGCALLLGMTVGVSILAAQELPPFPFAVPKDNGWDDCVQAAELMRAEGRPQPGDLFAQGRLPLTPAPEQLAQWKLVVDAHADVFDLVAKGLAKECVIPPEEALSFAEGGGGPLAGIPEIARLLVLVARYRAATGDQPGAARALADAVEFGQDVGRGGVLIHRMVAIACEAIALHNAHDMVMGHMLDADALRLLATRLEQVAPKRPPLSTAFAMESHLSDRHIQKHADGWRASGLDPAQARAQMLEAARQRAPLWDMPYPRFVEAPMGTAPPEIQGDRGQTIALFQPVSVFWRTKERDTAVVATLRGLQVMIALERYKLAKGEYPDTLEVLVPEYLAKLPEDPFSEKSFVYVGEKELYRLYSVGSNMTDDGGLAIRPLDSRAADLVFNIERPAQPRPEGFPDVGAAGALAPAPAGPVVFFGSENGAAALFTWLVVWMLWLLGP